MGTQWLRHRPVASIPQSRQQMLRTSSLKAGKVGRLADVSPQQGPSRLSAKMHWAAERSSSASTASSENDRTLRQRNIELSFDEKQWLGFTRWSLRLLFETRAGLERTQALPRIVCARRFGHRHRGRE